MNDKELIEFENWLKNTSPEELTKIMKDAEKEIGLNMESKGD